MGFLGLGSHHHHARHEVRLAGVGRVHRRRVARDGDRRLGSGARAGAREGPGADHERGVHGHRARCCASARRWRATAGRSATSSPGPRPARALQPLHAARRRSRAGAGGRAGRGRRALHAPQLDRADRHDLAVAGEQRVATASSPRSRITISATSSARARSRRRRSTSSPSSCSPTASWSTRARCRARRTPAEKLPDYFIDRRRHHARASTSTSRPPRRSGSTRSISKTANVPTDYPYEDFKDIYLYAHEKGLKGCTTFRFNPEAFQGVLVKEDDLKNTTYVFTLEDGTEIEVQGRRGDRVRRRDAHRRQSVRRVERRLLRQVLERRDGDAEQ